MFNSVLEELLRAMLHGWTQTFNKTTQESEVVPRNHSVAACRVSASVIVPNIFFPLSISLSLILAHGAEFTDSLIHRIMHPHSHAYMHNLFHFMPMPPYSIPTQFVYQRNRGTEDAIIYVLNSAYRYLEKPGCSIKIRFYDFSSAFNTIQPHLLVNKMKNMHLSTSFIAWILSYLTNRPKHVRLPITSASASTSSHAFVVSDTLYTNTGAPQGTVLSPFLFTLYTADGRQTDDSCPLVKFADDTS